MALEVDVDIVSQHVIGKAEEALTPVERAAVREVRAMACDAVGVYLRGSPVPRSVERSAVLRLAYYDYHSRLARRPADGGMLDARFRRDAPIGPLRASGAMSLLSPWKHRGLGVCR